MTTATCLTSCGPSAAGSSIAGGCSYGLAPLGGLGLRDRRRTRALALLLHASRQRDGGLRARVVDPHPARRGVERGRIAPHLAGDELPEGRVERARVDELPLPDDRAAQRAGHVAGAVAALLAGQGERLEHDLLELRRHVLRVVRRRLHDP